MVGILAGGGLFFLLISAGPFLAGKNTVPIKSDLIVILGGGSPDRVVKGVELFNLGYARTMLVTGGGYRPDRRLAWSDDRIKYLLCEGIPASAILLNGDARTTWQEAHAIRSIIVGRGWKRVLVVSDPPHMRRLAWVFKKAFTNSQLGYILISDDAKWWNSARWWADSYSVHFVVSELVKLAYYVLSYSYEPPNRTQEYSATVTLEGVH